MNMRDEVHTLLNCVLKARKKDVDMTVLTLGVLLCVAEEDGILVQDIIERVRSNKSSVSRVLAMLSDIGRREKEGLNLIRAVEDPLNRRFKRVYLTTEGAELVKDLGATMKRGCKKVIGG